MASTTDDEKDRSPPQSKRLAITVSWLVVLAGLLMAVDQLCFDSPVLWTCRCLAYGGLVLVLTGLALVIYCHHKARAYRDRLEDKSSVDASIVEARTVEPRLLDPIRPEKIEEKKKNLNDEVNRLQRIGPENWTEYEVLSLYQMLVDFLKPLDLIATTDSVMDELNEYAVDTKYRYDQEYYANWKERVDEATNEIKKIGDVTGIEVDDKSERLRAVLKTLYEHRCDFNLKWTKGSALIRDLLFVNAVAIPIFLTIALVPVIHPSDPGPLGVINLAMFGVTGALAGWLRSLHRSDLVEVGNTEGKREIWRTVSGTALGFVAGALTYGIIAGDLVNGAAVPSAGATRLALQDVGLTIVWGVAAGFSFERVFERVGTATEGSS